MKPQVMEKKIIIEQLPVAKEPKEERPRVLLPVPEPDFAELMDPDFVAEFKGAWRW